MYMKTYNAVFKEGEKNVFGISLVDDPAMKAMFIALKKENKLEPHKLHFAEVDKKERTLLGVVLVPDRPIYRNQGGEEFYINFTKEVIQKSAHNFLQRGFQLNSSLEHEDTVTGVSFVESWMVKDPKNDTANAYNLSKEDIVEGAWIVKMKCDNDEVYQKALDGTINGFSIDGFFGLEEIKLNKDNKMEEQIKTGFAKMTEDILVALNIKKGEIKLGSLNSADGSITFNYEGDTPQVGQAVWIMAEDGTRVPVPVGEIPLEDGSILVVEEEGIIAAVRMPEENGDQELEKDTTGNSDANSVISQVQESIKSIMIKYKEENDKKFTDFETKFTDLKKENVELKKEVVELSKQPASKPIKSTVTQREPNTKRERLTEYLNTLN